MPGVRVLLRNPGFVALLSYRLLSMFSAQIVAVTVGWHLYQLTADPLALGLVGLAEVLPYIGCALFAGYAVDHLSRRKVGMAACIGLGVTALVLAAVAAGWLPAAVGGLRAFTIYAAIAFNGVVRAFLGPVYMSLFARVLKRGEYVRGSSIGAAVMQTGMVFGPALGGLLIAAAGTTVSYLVATGFALVAAVVVVGLRVTEPALPLQREPMFRSIGEGLRFVRDTEVVFGALALDMFAVLFGGAVALLPAFVADVFEAGPEALGMLRAAPAAGAVLMSLWLARHPPQRHAGPWLFAAVAAFGGCIVGFGLSHWLWLSAVMLFLSGAFDSVSVVIRSTIVQLATPDHMRGRVASINGIFIGSSNELGAFESGVAARLLGLVPSVVFGGCMTLATVGLTAKLAPRLRRLDLRDLD
jgi:MFS family permease